MKNVFQNWLARQWEAIWASFINLHGFMISISTSSKSISSSVCWAIRVYFEQGVFISVFTTALLCLSLYSASQNYPHILCFVVLSESSHDDVIKWKHLPRYWSCVRGIHRSPVNSPHKGQWRRALMFSFICVWINGWVNNHEAGDFRRCRAHYGVTVMIAI